MRLLTPLDAPCLTLDSPTGTHFPYQPWAPRSSRGLSFAWRGNLPWRGADDLVLAQNVREYHVGFGEESHPLAIGRVRSVFDHPKLLASPAVRPELDANMGNVGPPLAYLGGDHWLDLIRRNRPHGRP